MASSAGPTSRSPRRCSAPRPRPCSSCPSSRWPRAGRGRGWSRCASAPLFRLPARRRDRCCGAIGVAVFAVVVYAGLAGTDSQQDNLAPTAVYVGFWVGVPFLSLLLGDWFRLFSPWRAIGRATGWVASRCRAESRGAPVPRASRPLAGRGGDPRVRDLRAVLGRPAASRGRSAVLMLIYVFVQLAGQGVYGVEAWTRRGDAFGVWFGLFAMLAPLGRRADGTLVLRPPVAGATRLRAGRRHGRAARDRDRLDGLRRRQRGRRCSTACGADLQDFFTSLGVVAGASGSSSRSSSGCWSRSRIVGALWRLGTEGMPRAGTGPRPHGSSAALRAHADPDRRRLRGRALLLAARLQRPGPVAAGVGPARRRLGPVRRRRRRGSTTRSSSATAIWYVQALALVAGHVAALVLAHDRALRRLRLARRRRRARRSSCWC